MGVQLFARPPKNPPRVRKPSDEVQKIARTTTEEVLQLEHRISEEIEASPEALAAGKRLTSRRYVRFGPKPTRQPERIVAAKELMVMGKPALPVLLSASTNAYASVRAISLPVMFEVSKNTKWKDELHILYLRAISDEDILVRRAGLGTLGKLLRITDEDVATYQKGITVTVKLLEDEDESMREAAGRILFRLGLAELVPANILATIRSESGSP